MARLSNLMFFEEVSSCSNPVTPLIFPDALLVDAPKQPLASSATKAMGTSSALGSVVRAWDVRDVSDQARSRLRTAPRGSAEEDGPRGPRSPRGPSEEQRSKFHSSPRAPAWRSLAPKSTAWMI